ncbi:exopolyphosphatase [Granulicella sp. 5B5]|uniref:Ppx/GppA phosphatase family protein n=1 Tax=Granulicella sp. 5B5 TaxID=1617967 RepID=UPI0015F58793|nr:Ppx/GppA phosphatase family protein [Granulicella sp. 5B5]QMV19636.1 exopolyphosphatase [Granulicella sp. 5B5]
MPTFAAIDIGSNSCRLAIAAVQQHKLKILQEDREVTRLGESVFDTGVISPEAMANTIRALKRFQKTTQTYVVDRVRVVATSAMRDARNSDAFRAWVKSSTGWTVDVISGLEEGRLIHLGVTTMEPGARGRCLLVDLGGGSCEVTLSDGGRIKQMVSLPLGAVRLQQEFLMQNDPPSKDDVARLRKFIERELRRGERKLGLPKVATVIATSGTASALAEASVALSEGTRVARAAKKSVSKKTTRSGPMLEADTASVRMIADKLLKLNNAERASMPGIGPKRSEIIMGGAQVYAMLLERLQLKGFRYSPLGLRDGVLEQMLADVDTRASAHRTMEAERWEGVLEVCKRYGIDPKKAGPECQHVEQLFDQLIHVHELPAEYRLWLRAAAMMQEVGKFMNHQGHHRHTQYIIANSEIFGFSPEQRAIVAAIARYLGKSRPEAEDRPMRSVPVEEHVHVQRSVVLLRLAQALNQDRATAAMKLRINVFAKRVLLELEPPRGRADLEVWALKKEAPYFREVFRRELFVEVA